MVLKKIVNDSGKDIFLSWGPWNYSIKKGGELINPPTDVLHAMQERYKGIIICNADESVEIQNQDMSKPDLASSLEPSVEVTEEEIIRAETPVEDIVRVRRGRPKKIA